MSVRQVSIDTTTTDIKSYVCGFEDAVSTYPTDCGAGSDMVVIGRDGKMIRRLFFDGSEWDYKSFETDFEDTLEIDTVHLDGGVYEFDMDKKSVKRIFVVAGYDTPQGTTLTIDPTDVVTTAGDAEVTLTSADVDGPLTFVVPLLENDTANEIAEAVRVVLAADETVSYVFSVDGVDNEVILMKLDSEENDATLNLAIADDTSVGVTTVATSVNIDPTADAKIFRALNVPTECTIYAEVEHIAVTEFGFPELVTVVWSDDTPSPFVAEKFYDMEFKTRNGGRTWYAKATGSYTR